MFGCLCCVYQNQRIKDKFGPRSRKRIFVGYSHSKQGWKVYDLETGNIFVNRDVIFNENCFPYAENTEASQAHSNEFNSGLNKASLDDVDG